MKHRRATTALLGGLLLALPAACQATPRAISHETRHLAGEGLEARQPADIALAPLRNQSSTEDVPLDDLRQSFYEGLIRRLYSPLDLAYVDQHWTEASAFAGAPPPDALLMVAITEWDASRLASKGVVRAAAELRLFDGGTANGPVLWGVSIRREIDLGLRERQAGLLRDLVPRAIRAFTDEVLAELPERDPVVAPR